jgi:hypothetical protein
MQYDGRNYYHSATIFTVGILEQFVSQQRRCAGMYIAIRTTNSLILTTRRGVYTKAISVQKHAANSKVVEMILSNSAGSSQAA